MRTIIVRNVRSQSAYYNSTSVDPCKASFFTTHRPFQAKFANVESLSCGWPDKCVTLSHRAFVAPCSADQARFVRVFRELRLAGVRVEMAHCTVLLSDVSLRSSGPLHRAETQVRSECLVCNSCHARLDGPVATSLTLPWSSKRFSLLDSSF